MIDLTYDYAISDMKNQLSKLQTVQEREGRWSIWPLPSPRRLTQHRIDAIVSLLSSLPRSSVAKIQVRLGPLLRLDILGVRF